MLSLILLPLYFFLFIGLFLQLTLYTCLLISFLLSPSLFFFLFFFIFLQSKHKKDAFAIRPILLNKLEVEICLSLLPFARVLIAMCHHVPHFSLSFSFCIYMYASPLIMHSFLFYFSFFRLSSSPSPSITPQLRRFLLPWAHP